MKQYVNPLQYRGNYSATSNDMMLVNWPLMGRLVYHLKALVRFPIRLP